MYIASGHIQQWIRTGDVVVASVAVASQLDSYLSKLPWLPSGSGLDRTVMRGKQADLTVLTDDELLDWFRTTPIGKDRFVIMLFAADQPCIICNANFAISNIDHLFWGAPGKRYVFGASVRGEIVEPAFDHFAEYDHAGSLTVAVP